MPDIQRVGVCGCGLMGSGIAQVAATAGHDVIVLEAVQAALDKGMAAIRKSFDKFVEKGGMSAADREEFLARTEFLGRLRDATFTDENYDVFVLW